MIRFYRCYAFPEKVSMYDELETSRMTMFHTFNLELSVNICFEYVSYLIMNIIFSNFIQNIYC